uniref:Uncharacterized protein n=1 Tax=Leptocylindrus danicus TaxID=163516 RepID=A0A7S2JQR3_9STRA|eukprot:CAMPEP_0116015624 /NCGR_PEP_ID=MMETSP0321-20121206/6959_1 /TAXON_ID=163516 /ORGANISM="Leptocylindrus danicus var. danicus, Strain B650" /LENGTH=211 /DNA_ID=CAMNT_0003485453 /DNA_START=65 /DNA_END=700 /DNA_ORIENTATION=-
MSELEDARQQLIEVRELLSADPDNAEFVTLESDLIELITILSAGEASANLEQSVNEEEPLISATTTPLETENKSGNNLNHSKHDDINVEEKVGGAEPDVAKSKKKSKVQKEKSSRTFVVPDNLIILESDSAAEKARKKRTVKSLKGKFREKRKEHESNKKQQSWQDFQKKKKKGTKEGSIWATNDHIDGKVGVVGKRTMSEYGDRKRYKLG